MPRFVGRSAAALPDARALDRLVRGRAWIAIVACALVGIVYLQVSLLGMNAGITRSLAVTQSLETQNSLLQSQIAQAGAGGRVQDAAASAGMVLPPAAWATYDSVRPGDAAIAARLITAPDPSAELRNAAANAALVPPDALPTISPQDAQTAAATSPAIAPSADGATAAAASAGSGATGATAPPATSDPATSVTPTQPVTPVQTSTPTPTPTPAPTPVVAASTPAAGSTTGAATSTVTPTEQTSGGVATGGVSPSAAGPG